MALGAGPAHFSDYETCKRYLSPDNPNSTLAHAVSGICATVATDLRARPPHKPELLSSAQTHTTTPAPSPATVKTTESRPTRRRRRRHCLVGSRSSGECPTPHIPRSSIQRQEQVSEEEGEVVAALNLTRRWRLAPTAATKQGRRRRYKEISRLGWFVTRSSAVRNRVRGRWVAQRRSMLATRAEQGRRQSLPPAASSPDRSDGPCGGRIGASGGGPCTRFSDLVAPSVFIRYGSLRGSCAGRHCSRRGGCASAAAVEAPNQNDVHDGNPQKTADKAPGLESNSLPISSASPVTTNTEELNGKKQDKEECTVAGSWLPNAQSMNFYVESPAVQVNNSRVILMMSPSSPTWTPLFC
ncbi:hypothetical protein Tsubulata_044647 [Turnera subulata]|uniref:Uncharacterized protein n=1 Tax=Turnera subulata TaxID=218843 RepID=A0A9Q0JH04_9ROSI|nr:hypothetical protein Tsubulata_044647 [Turnera subulata]